MTLAEKFTRLKTSVGGNREKCTFEDTFGMPKEEQAHITRPGRANARILAELEFALHLTGGRKQVLRRCFGGSAGLFVVENSRLRAY